MSADPDPRNGNWRGRRLGCPNGALAVWLRADIRALETDVRADIRALDGRINILAERMGDLGECVARLEARPD